MSKAMSKHTVSPDVYAKVKEWRGQHRTVYRMVCANMGCLAESYSPHDPRKEKIACPRCRTMGGGHFDQVEKVYLKDLEVKEPDIVEVEAGEVTLSIDDAPCWAAVMGHPAAIVISWPQHWRPVKAPIGIFDDLEQEEIERVVKDFEEKASNGSWTQDEGLWEYVSSIMAESGYRLVMHRMETGRILRVQGHPMGGLWDLVMEKPDGSETSVPVESGFGIRQLVEAFGSFKAIHGKTIRYYTDALGVLAGFEAVAITGGKTGTHLPCSTACDFHSTANRSPRSFMMVGWTLLAR